MGELRKTKTMIHNLNRVYYSVIRSKIKQTLTGNKITMTIMLVMTDRETDKHLAS